MDDDQDNDEREDDNLDDDDENPKRTFNKKKYFGKTTRDLRLLTMRAYYKPKSEYLKAFKITFENNINNFFNGNMFSPLKIKLNHKQTYFDINSKTKANLSAKLNQVQSYDFTNSLTKNISNHTFGISTKANNKGQGSVKLNHTLKWWENDWKLKYGFEADKKKEVVYGGSLNLERKKSLQNKDGWLKFISNYSDTIGFGVNLKSNFRKKFETFYKSNLVTMQGHRAYLQHKLSYDPQNTSPFNNTFTLNCQDSLGIGTFNGTLSFDNFTVKNKEVRFLLEFEKKWVFGVQRKNDLYELVMQKNKIGYSWLKNIKANVGNKGLFASADGKVNLFKTGFDYTVSYKLKPLQQNFYEDSSLGFSVKWNI